VLLRALVHPCNKGYDTSMRILKYFNGEPVLNMKQFVEAVSASLQSKQDLLQFTFAPLQSVDTAGSPDDPDIVLDAHRCKGADQELMRSHEVGAPVSPDLQEQYKALPVDFTLMPGIFEEANTEKSKHLRSSKPDSRHVQKEMTIHHHKAQHEALHEKIAHGIKHPDVTAAAKSKEGKPQGAEVLQDSVGRNGLLELPWQNIVQIRLVSAGVDFLSPWKMEASSGSRCSAIIVNKEKRMILTNSHCVADAMSLDILREDVPVPVPARVVEIAHDVDLAWITTDSDSFWANQQIQPVVSLAEGLPHLSHNVRVVGYPQGGSSITITQGIVSRVDGQIYPNGLIPGARNTPNNLLIMQVDAAINPGNSGGPVFNDDGHLVGLAFAGVRGAQNIGYVIPNVHLHNFVASVESPKQHHRWKAQSEVGAVIRRIENSGIRKLLKLKAHETGVQIRSVAPGSTLEHHGIKKGDVMLQIDGMPLQGDGTVTRHINGKMVSLPFDTIVTEKPHGNITKLEFMHIKEDGSRDIKKINAVFKPVPPLVPRFYDAPVPVKGREHFAAKPTFFILWGLVWGTLSNPLLQRALKAGKDVPWSVTRSALHRWRQNDDEDVVVLMQGLGGSACTLNYDTSVMRAVKYFNGKRVHSMRDLVTYAIQGELNGEDFLRVTFEPLADEDTAGDAKDPDIVLHRQFCGLADAQILQANNIPKQFSDDVAGYVKHAMRMHEVEAKRASPAVPPTHSLMEAKSHGSVHVGGSIGGAAVALADRNRMAVSNTDDFQEAVHAEENGPEKIVKALATDGLVNEESMDVPVVQTDSDELGDGPILLAQLLEKHRLTSSQSIKRKHIGTATLDVSQ